MDISNKKLDCLSFFCYYLQNNVGIITMKAIKTSKKKYPKTYHVPWSLAIQSDDKMFKSMQHFHGKEIVATEKLDGENTTISTEYYHARSLDSTFNWTRSWLATMHACLKYEIPEGMKLVGENLFAKHAIEYPDYSLEGYFYLFSIWEDIVNNEEDYCLDYDDIVSYAALFDLPMPKVLYRGIYDEAALKKIAAELDTTRCEGYVIRTVDGFMRSEFTRCVAKFVRANHVQDNSEHWLKTAVQNGRLPDVVKPSYMSKS